MIRTNLITVAGSDGGGVTIVGYLGCCGPVGWGTRSVESRTRGIL